jgi:hypothetical protein
MTDEFGDFRTPMLHLVIADDEADWQNRLKSFFAAQIDEWSLYRTGQFRFEMHCCGSYEEFTEITGDLLRKGDLVYATVDLVMPWHKADEAKDHSVWKDLILWCLDREYDPSAVGNTFEFCVISGEDQMLTDLFQDARHGVALERNGVKRAFKQQIRNDPEVALRKIWEDVRTFVLHNIRFCTLPETWGGTSQTIVWFGRHEALFRLLERTDEIARRQKKSDFYMAFADACGYEEHWFRLCCHLKGLEQPHISNLAETNWRDDGWRKDLQNPPSALLLSHIRGSQGHHVHDRMQEADFFNALDTGGGLACFQFPQLNSDIDADRLLEPEERKVLESCFARVYGHGAPFGHGEGSQYRDSEHIIRFPDYETLKAAGVVRATIAFKVKQCQEAHGLDGISVDPEVLEILAEIPWNETPARGLDGLSMVINAAYEKAAARKGQLGQDIGLDFFPKEPVQNHFGSSRGFAIRGRRLVQLLDRHWGGGWSTTASEAVEKQFGDALAGLEQIHELFESLQRLIELAGQLQSDQGRIEFPENFPLADFEALKDAHEFLLRIFFSPDALRKSIAEFRRRHEHDRNWPDYYPSLEAREDWRELIEHVQFTWPYRKFRLPTPIDDYLRFSGVIAEIYREMGRVLPRHPDLELQWRDLETQRRALEEQLQEREVQRRAARRYAREGQSQPVLLLLGMRADENKLRFTTTLQSFLFFNAALAVCENLYRFNGDFCSTGDVKQFLERAELGKAIQVLRNYRKKLSEEGRLQDSIFRRWVDEWPESGRQENAARAIARIAGRTLSDPVFSKRLKGDQKDLLRQLSGLMQSPSRCSIEDMLTFIGMLRNMFDKNYTQRFWDEQIEDLHDALRGFVLSTTDADFRFGRVSEDGGHALFWSRNKLEADDGVPPFDQFKGRLCVFDRQPLQAAYTCFPIDDLIRINPDDGSPFAYSLAGKWVDLTSTDAAFRPESDSEWLPNRKEREESAVWRWTYEWSS